MEGKKSFVVPESYFIDNKLPLPNTGGSVKSVQQQEGQPSQNPNIELILKEVRDLKQIILTKQSKINISEWKKP
jgi:hypothetical protein